MLFTLHYVSWVVTCLPQATVLGRLQLRIMHTCHVPARSSEESLGVIPPSCLQAASPPLASLMINRCRRSMQRLQAPPGCTHAKNSRSCPTRDIPICKNCLRCELKGERKACVPACWDSSMQSAQVAHQPSRNPGLARVGWSAEAYVAAGGYGCAGPTAAPCLSERANLYRQCKRGMCLSIHSAASARSKVLQMPVCRNIAG
jgi:hypothetical protein